ncbi:MAG: hypothetical protein AB7I44_10625 [Hyphomicrobiaceae bacterium]
MVLMEALRAPVNEMLSLRDELPGSVRDRMRNRRRPPAPFLSISGKTRRRPSATALKAAHKRRKTVVVKRNLAVFRAFMRPGGEDGHAIELKWPACGITPQAGHQIELNGVWKPFKRYFSAL